ncbi:MAG: hypothetical protein RXP92_02605 [Candidatus Micrarchaeota archaeon]
MVEPKIEEKKPKPQPQPNPEPKPQPRQSPEPMATPQAQGQAQNAEALYQTLLNGMKLLHVSNIAAFKVKNGLAIIPVDDLGRPLFDSNLYFSSKLLDKLRELIDKLGEEK